MKRRRLRRDEDLILYLRDARRRPDGLVGRLLLGPRVHIAMEGQVFTVMCLVLIGEAGHGTLEFYRIRAAITKASDEIETLWSNPAAEAFNGSF